MGRIEALIIRIDRRLDVATAAAVVERLRFAGREREVIIEFAPSVECDMVALSFIAEAIVRRGVSVPVRGLSGHAPESFAISACRFPANRRSRSNERPPRRAAAEGPGETVWGAHAVIRPVTRRDRCDYGVTSLPLLVVERTPSALAVTRSDSLRSPKPSRDLAHPRTSIAAARAINGGRHSGGSCRETTSVVAPRRE